MFACFVCRFATGAKQIVKAARYVTLLAHLLSRMRAESLRIVMGLQLIILLF